MAVFRFAALCYAAILLLTYHRQYSRPWLGVVVLAGMLGWSIVTAVAYADPGRRRWPLLGVDLFITLLSLLASSWVIPRDMLRHGSPTLPMAWVAGGVLAWAIAGGRRWGVFAVFLVGVVDLTLRGSITATTLNGTVLLLLAAFCIGYMIKVAGEAEARMQRATELEAATRERERLARGIHDSVLQVLALVQRRGTELGGEAAELGRLAGEQEATLRALVGVTPFRTSEGSCDLRSFLSPFASATVTIASPATAVPLPCATAAEISAAVGAALDNVVQHTPPGTRAWVLVEDEPDTIVVTVRDDGPGIAPGRLAEAAAAGRLGISQSVRGRLRDLGGAVAITTTPGEGTEVELRVPRKLP